VSPLILDEFIAEFIKLADLATRIMNEHTIEHDLCAICGSAWPCERIVLAEHNLSIV
jgi:hypothetical protein